MVLEYASGGDIWKHIRDLGRFSNEVARFYSAEVVLALDYLHSQHIIYYDLKPENLMLDAAGHVKLIDFGFARSTTDECTAVRGTPEYLAPEVVEGGHHSVMVDWWALGCLVYEMMVGVPPFVDEFRRLGVCAARCGACGCGEVRGADQPPGGWNIEFGGGGEGVGGAWSSPQCFLGGGGGGLVPHSMRGGGGGGSKGHKPKSGCHTRGPKLGQCTSAKRHCAFKFVGAWQGGRPVPWMY